MTFSPNMASYPTRRLIQCIFTTTATANTHLQTFRRMTRECEMMQRCRLSTSGRTTRPFSTRRRLFIATSSANFVISESEESTRGPMKAVRQCHCQTLLTVTVAVSLTLTDRVSWEWYSWIWKSHWCNGFNRISGLVWMNLEWISVKIFHFYLSFIRKLSSIPFRLLRQYLQWIAVNWILVLFSLPHKRGIPSLPNLALPLAMHKTKVNHGAKPVCTHSRFLQASRSLSNRVRHQLETHNINNSAAQHKWNQTNGEGRRIECQLCLQIVEVVLSWQNVLRIYNI